MRSTRGIVSLILRVALLFLVTGCAFGTLRSKPGTTTTVILLRHADRNVGSDDLNGKGRERAKALVDAVSGMGVTAVYSPDMKRNLDTVRPLAAQLKIDITVKADLSVWTARDMVEEILSKHAGGVVVFVGNVSGNLEMVYRHLGGTGPSPKEYGELFVVRVPDQGRVEVDRKRFGP